MVIAGHVTAVPDSEEELFSSSPAALLDGTGGQLDGTADERPRDASSQRGGSPNLLEVFDVNKTAERTANTCNNEQQLALDDVHSLESVARANLESDMLANELAISLPNASSRTDTCDSSSQHPSAPTKSSPVHNLNKQENAAETASGGGKEPIIPFDESGLDPAINTPSVLASASTCANHDSTATDTKLLNHDDQLVLPPLEDTHHPACSGITPTVSTVEGGLPDERPTRQDPTGVLSAEGALSSQQGHPQEPHLSPYVGENGPQNGNVDSGDAKGRGFFCPPRFSPADSSSSSNVRAPRRSMTVDGATLTQQKTQYEEREDAKSPELPRSTTEDSIQPSVSTADESTIVLSNITMEHTDQDSFMKSVQSLSVPTQKPRVEDVGKRNPEQPRFVVSADLAPSLGSTNEPAEVHVSEAASIALRKLNKVREAATTESINQNEEEHTEMKRAIVPLPVAEVAATESTLNAITHTSSSAASITEDPQLTPAKSQQEITLAEMKTKRAALIASIAHLPAIQVLLADARTSGLSSQMSEAEPTEADIMAAAHKINKKHIKLLHEYNEIKDVGQGLMGLIADQRGLRIVEVQDDFGIGSKD